MLPVEAFTLVLAELQLLPSCSRVSGHGSAELQLPAGQHPRLRGGGSVQCLAPGLYLLQRLYCESNLNHRNENLKFKLNVAFSSLVAVSKLKILSWVQK